MKRLPIDADVGRTSLIPRRKESLPRNTCDKVRWTDGIRVIQVVQNHMVQPKARIRVSIGAVGICESCLDVCDETVFAWYLNGSLEEILHSIVDIHVWDIEGSVCDLGSLRSLAGEELGG